MSKSLRFLVICALLSPSQGETPVIRSIYNLAAAHNIILAGTLHDGLLQNLLKEHIVLPDINIGGLLGSIGKIAQLKVVNAELIGYTVVFVPEINGGEVTAKIKLEITGNALLAASSLVKISLELMSRLEAGLANFSEGTYDVIIHECDCQFGAIDVSLLGSSILSSVLSTIRGSLTSNINRQICPVMTVVLNAVKQLKVSLINVDLPFGSYGVLKYHLTNFPKVNDADFVMDISADFELAGGGLISIPEDAISINLPSIQNYTLCHSLNPAFLNMVMSVVGKIEPQELSCVHDACSELKDALLALIPPGSVMFIKISPLNGPVIDLTNDRGVAQLTAQIEVFFKNADGSITSILILSDILSLATMFFVVGGRPALTMSIDSHDLQLVSSSVGISEVASLVPHCNSLLGERILPLLNGPIGGGVPLPSTPGISLDNANIRIAKGALVICA